MAVRLKPSRRPAYITAARQRAIWRCGPGVRPLPAFRPRILPRPADWPERAGPVPSAVAAARPARAPPPAESAPLFKEAEILLGTLHDYKITISAGRHASIMVASSVVIDTGPGASVIWHKALPDEWHAAITPHASGGGLRLRDANNNQLVMSGTVYLLFRAGRLCVACTFQVVANLSVSALLVCDFLDAHTGGTARRRRFFRAPMTRSTAAPQRPACCGWHTRRNWRHGRRSSPGCAPRGEAWVRCLAPPG